MKYYSTRNKKNILTSAEAIVKGLAADGGLFVPETLPKFSIDDIAGMQKLNYRELAKKILGSLLTDFTADEVSYCVENAYTTRNFETDKIVPVATLDDTTHILELWHGPTCAFKDMALQIMPYLLTTSMKKTGEQNEVVILVATSGDTGKAALEGFSDVEKTKIIVFFPENGVSEIQKLQMTTQSGNNVGVFGVFGNFDDAQNGVKRIFTDNAFAEKLKKNNMVLSSANSINWGRLSPQIVYYFSAYCQLVSNKAIKLGDKINFVVPTGNFGNILAGYYAKLMGLPVNKLICASNENNVLTDFINNGEYDKNRRFVTSLSPSMDILISSNLERFLFNITDADEKAVTSYMDSLKAIGKYKVSDDIKQKIQSQLCAGYCDDAETLETIKSVFDRHSYVLDTHTAVAVNVYKKYKSATGDDTKTVILSTASPYKFAGSVLSAISGQKNDDAFETINALNKVSALSVPESLAGLSHKEVRFKETCDPAKMSETVEKHLGL